MSKSNTILVFRFSALGDIAMTVPIIASFLKSYPDKKIIYVSRSYVQNLFSPIDRLTFVSFNPETEHKGIIGLWKLFRSLKSMGKYDFVADLHNVLRTKFLSFLFKISGTMVIKIDKGRKEKRELTRKKNKKLIQLKSTFSRYYDVFEKAGYHFLTNDFDGKSLYINNKNEISPLSISKSSTHIGIAPFAKHQGKTWSLQKMKELVEILNSRQYQIYLFGGRGNEQNILESWASEYANVHNLAGKFYINEELIIMSELDLMLSMDSANMHLARLVNTPVISIWGATHPYAGFYAWKMPEEWAVQIDLDCRPSSIYGNKPCYRGDFACMNNITKEMVIAKIDMALKK